MWVSLSQEMTGGEEKTASELLHKTIYIRWHFMALLQSSAEFDLL